MLIHHRFAALLLLPLFATTAFCQDISREPIDLERVNELRIVEGKIEGRQIVDYLVSAKRSQILSVDLLTSNASNYFNILPADTNQAIFVGSTKGRVADVPLPETGAYVIRVYLMRSAARRNETANYAMGISLGQQEFADGLSGGPDFWKVAVAGGSGLNLRFGPATRYQVIGQLRNGQVLQNRGCRLTGSERWCSIRAMHSGITGWVAGRYLVESAPPPRPASIEGGPKGNGVPFDATGLVFCSVLIDQPMRPCPFGVVRQGPGNAGLWVALGNGVERHILFEGGLPVATTPADRLSFEKVEDNFRIRIGEERFEFPEAVITGG